MAKRNQYPIDPETQKFIAKCLGRLPGTVVIDYDNGSVLPQPDLKAETGLIYERHDDDPPSS